MSGSKDNTSFFDTEAAGINSNNYFFLLIFCKEEDSSEESAGELDDMERRQENGSNDEMDEDEDAEERNFIERDDSDYGKRYSEDMDAELEEERVKKSNSKNKSRVVEEINDEDDADADAENSTQKEKKSKSKKDDKKSKGDNLVVYHKAIVDNIDLGECKSLTDKKNAVKALMKKSGDTMDFIYNYVTVMKDENGHYFFWWKLKDEKIKKIPKGVLLVLTPAGKMKESYLKHKDLIDEDYQPTTMYTTPDDQTYEGRVSLPLWVTEIF